MEKKDILALVEEDAWMMDVLRAVRTLHLPDWWVAAGFVRNKVWDALHGYTRRTSLSDIDVIFFDPANTDEGYEKELEGTLRAVLDEPWSVKNQARMYLVNNEAPYTSSDDALSRWVETATCVGVRLTEEGELVLCAPHGIEDLVHLKVRPGPAFSRDRQYFEKRWREKRWLELWPKLTIEP